MKFPFYVPLIALILILFLGLMMFKKKSTAGEHPSPSFVALTGQTLTQCQKDQQTLRQVLLALPDQSWEQKVQVRPEADCVGRNRIMILLAREQLERIHYRLPKVSRDTYHPDW